LTDCAICGRRIRASQDVVIVGGMTVHANVWFVARVTARTAMRRQMMHGNLLCLPAAYKALPAHMLSRSCFQTTIWRHMGLPLRQYQAECLCLPLCTSTFKGKSRFQLWGLSSPADSTFWTDGIAPWCNQETNLPARDKGISWILRRWPGLTA